MFSLFKQGSKCYPVHRRIFSRKNTYWPISTGQGVLAGCLMWLCAIGLASPVMASIPITLDVSDGYTFSGEQRSMKTDSTTGDIILSESQPIGPFSASPSTQHILSWNRGEADDFLNCDPTMPVHSVSDSIINRIEVHYAVDASATPGNVTNVQVVIPSFENAGIGTTTPFPLSALTVELTLTLPDGSTTTIPLFSEPPPTGIAAVYTGMLATPFPIDGMGAVDTIFTGEVQPSLGPLQTFPLNCPTPNEGLTGIEAFGVTQLILQNAYTILFIDEPGTTDTDGDGVPNGEDQCPNSDLSPTVTVNGCDSEVDNIRFSDGCTLADLSQDAFNSGTLAGLLNDLVDEGVLTQEDAKAISDCAGGDPIGFTTVVDIDVKPGNDKNMILTSETELKVAILSDKATDFQPTRDVVTRNHRGYEISDPRFNKSLVAAGFGTTGDFNNDEIDDVVICFDLQQMIKGGIIDLKTKQLRLIGFLSDNTKFIGGEISKKEAGSLGVSENSNPESKVSVKEKKNR